MKTLGNTSLLERKKIGYFASGTIASLSVLPTLDWATEIAKREDVAIVSGFHSKMPKLSTPKETTPSDINRNMRTP